MIDTKKATTTTLSTTTEIKREGRSRNKRSSTKTFVQQQRRRSLSHDDIRMLKHVQLKENVSNISRSTINKQRHCVKDGNQKYELLPSCSTNRNISQSRTTNSHHNGDASATATSSHHTNRLINLKSLSSSVSLSSTRVWLSLRHISSLTSIGSSNKHHTSPSTLTTRSNKSFSSLANTLALQRTAPSIDQTKRLHSSVTKVLGMTKKFQWSKLRKYIKNQKLKQQPQFYYKTLIEECWRQSSSHLLQQESFSCDHDDHFGKNLLHIICQGHPPIDIIEQIMNHCPFEMNVIVEDCSHNECHHTPLHVACMYGANTKVVECLLNHASHVASWKDYEGKTPLHLHCEYTCGIINTCDPYNYTKEQHYEYSNKVFNQQEETAVLQHKEELDTGLFLQHEQNCSYITFGPVWDIIKLLHNSSSSCINDEDNYGRNPIEYCLGITGANTQTTTNAITTTSSSSSSSSNNNTSAMEYVILQYTKDILKQIQELSIHQWSLDAAEIRRKQLESMLQQQQEEQEHQQSLTTDGGSSEHSRRRSSTCPSRFSMTQRRRSLSIPSILTKSHAEQMIVESNGINILQTESSTHNDLEEPEQVIDKKSKYNKSTTTTTGITFLNNNINNKSDDSCNDDFYNNNCRDEEETQKQSIITTTKIESYSTTEEEKESNERIRHGLLLMKQIQHSATDLLSVV